MNVMYIHIVQSCNQNCDYCPMKEWLYPLDFQVPMGRTDNFHAPAQPGEVTYPINRITNDVLLAWLDKYIRPDEWVLEITGGEPGLYKEIDTLIPALCECGYHGLIKTNGSMPIPKSDNFKRIAAWHKGIETIPPYYDEILILKNIDDCYQDKVAYCEKHSIPYKLLPMNHAHDGAPQLRGPKPIRFLYCSIVMSMGQVYGCVAGAPMEGKSIFDDTPPILQPLWQSDQCHHCTKLPPTEVFLDGELQRHVLDDYNNAAARTQDTNVVTT